MKDTNMKIKKSNIFVLLIFIITLIWSSRNDYSYIIWFFNVLPIIVIVLTLVLTYRRFKFSNCAYISVLIYLVISLIGVRYNHQTNPFFDLYSKYYYFINYFIQAFTFTFIIKEFYSRKNFSRGTDLEIFFIIALSVFIIEVYEGIKFIGFKVLSVPAYREISFNQMHSRMTYNMLSALLGSIIAIIVFGKVHNRQRK